MPELFLADLELTIRSISTRVTLIAAVVLGVCAVIAILNKNRVGWLKVPLFVGMAGAMALSTIFLFAATIFLNVKSESGGPVHWHADVEFWACGTELELRDPTGFLSNKIGTTTLHEHNDKRIHLEGNVVENYDATLGKFMSVIGGNISDSRFSLPLNEDPATWEAVGAQRDGDQHLPLRKDEISGFITKDVKGLPVASFKTGDSCARNNAEVQVFAYRFNKESNTYKQTKLDNPEGYGIAPESVVPPGDCIIVEFDQPKDRTNRLCKQFGVRDKDRCQEFGVTKGVEELCTIKEVR